MRHVSRRRRAGVRRELRACVASPGTPRTLERRTAASARRPSSRILFLVGYYTQMRRDNNRSLDWEDIALDAATMRGTFKLDQHKNVNKGNKARGSIARELVEYLLSIRPANAVGPIHANPATGWPYVASQSSGNDYSPSPRKCSGTSRPARRQGSSTSATPARPTSVSAGALRATC